MDFCGKNEQKCQICHIYVLASEWRQMVVFHGLIMFHCSYDLKYEYYNTFPLWGRVKLNFSDRYKKTTYFFLRTQVAINFFHLILKNSLWCIKNYYLPIWICMTHIWSPTLFHRAIIGCCLWSGNCRLWIN